MGAAVPASLGHGRDSFSRCRRSAIRRHDPPPARLPGEQVGRELLNIDHVDVRLPLRDEL